MALIVRSSVQVVLAGRRSCVAVSDDAVADLPAGDCLGQRDVAVALLRGRAELDPGAAQRRAVEVHPPAAADDRRAGLLVQPLDVVQADHRRVLGRDRARSGVPTSSAGRGWLGDRLRRKWPRSRSRPR